MIQTVLFYLFAAVLLFSAVKVVTAKHPVHATLWLVLSFWTSACTWILMQAEFLGVVLVLVYVGAVMVLLLFVVMMLNVDHEALRAGFWRHLPISFTVGVLMAAMLIVVLIAPDTKLSSFGQLHSLPQDYDGVRALGEKLYTVYLLPFELAAVLLVLGMVAAIALVHRHNPNPKLIAPAEQIAVEAKNRVRIIKMQAERQEVLEEAAGEQK